MTVVKLPVKSECYRHFDDAPNKPEWVIPVDGQFVTPYGQPIPNGYYVLREQTGNYLIVRASDMHSLYSPTRDETDLELAYRFLERHGFSYISSDEPGDFQYVRMVKEAGWTSLRTGCGWGNEGSWFEADYDGTGKVYACGMMGEVDDEPV